jgi:DNA-binding transcriptional LysR family regulator
LITAPARIRSLDALESGRAGSILKSAFVAFDIEWNSSMRRAELADLGAFVAVADQLNFRAAASRLGVSPSAVSHSMRTLEERLGVRLFNRTTRSVSLTDAGLRLLDELRPAVSQIQSALEGLNLERQRPYGRLRIYATHMAATAVIAPIWARFLSMYPDVHFELRVDETPIDIVSKGYDAGIGPRNRIATDMTAVRVTGPLKIAVIAAPAYFARRKPPRTPGDLARHSCIQYRLATDGPLFEWPFSRNGKEEWLPVDGRVIVNTPELAVRAALDGLGVACTLEAQADLFLRSGQLVRVLEDYSPSIEGLHLYYPGHRQVPAALRALIDMIRTSRRTGESACAIQNPFVENIELG